MTLSRLALELTTRCNLSCRHCLREIDPKPADLSIPLLERVLDQARRGYRIETVAITGGEPLLHPRFEAALEAIASRGLTFSIVTNGLLIPKRIKLLGRADLRPALAHVAVSLEGDNPETHDAIRGPGTFKKAMAGILALKAAGLPFGIKYSIGTHNHQTLEAATLSLAHLEPGFITFSHLTPTPDNLRAGLIPSPAERLEAEAAVRRLSRELKTTVNLSADLYCGSKFYSCSSLAMIEFYIDARGRLGFCCVLPGLRGSGGDKSEIIADLNQVDLFEAHRRLIDAIAAFQRDRASRLEVGGLDGVDSFQCLACARYFGKLDWLDPVEAGAWLAPFSRRDD